MTTALALRPPPPPKDTRQDEPDSFGKKDVRLSEKALELRRRVEKRRQEAQDKFQREAELVLQRQQNKQKRHVIAQQEVHGSERLVDADLLHNHHELFKRSGHQFNLGEKYERLGRDTQRALRATRENQNKLNYLEGRIRRLRDDVNGVPRGHADDEVDQMLKRARDDTTQLGFRKFFQKCDKCGARVTREHFEGHRRVCPGAPPELGNSSDDDAEAQQKGCETEECVVCGLTKPRDKIKAHVKRCKKRQQYIRDRKQASKAVQMKPQPPRDLRVGKITATTIELKWAPPILDGGATVFEYEVVFSVTTITRVGKKVNKTVSALPPLQTTCYMYQEPVCEYGYVLTELRASTEYSEFRVRCKNEDDIQEALNEHKVEAGPLMKKVLESSKFRFIALCATNMKGNEVMGGASGGVGMCATACEKNIIVFWMKNGKQRRVFTGDDEGRHLGDPEGHTALVSALHFTGSRVYSGGMDSRIFVWDTSETSLNRAITGERWNLTEDERRGAMGRPLMLLEGHEASVTAIQVERRTCSAPTFHSTCHHIYRSRPGSGSGRPRPTRRTILPLSCPPCPS